MCEMLQNETCPGTRSVPSLSVSKKKPPNGSQHTFVSETALKRLSMSDAREPRRGTTRVGTMADAQSTTCSAEGARSHLLGSALKRSGKILPPCLIQMHVGQCQTLRHILDVPMLTTLRSTSSFPYPFSYLQSG